MKEKFEEAGMAGKELGVWLSVLVSPLCLSLLSTAIVLQHAFGLRLASVPDDGVLPPLSGFVSQAALYFLIAGYAVSLAAIAGFILKTINRRRQNQEKGDDLH